MEDLQFGREKNREYSTIVSLEPFAHQVGGHSTLQLLDKFTVCKPLFTKELRFYQDANPLFKPFLPEFKGVARVRNVYGKDSGEGLWEMVNSNEDVNRHCYRYGKHCTSCTCIGNSERTGKRISNKGVDNRISENFYRAAVSKDKDKNEDDSSLEYLLLENVVGRYKYPCILDLKMGTEKHRDYVISQEEQSLRQARWDKTTSKSLGVRLCGMKVYHVNEDRFLVVSDGRTLTVDGFKDAIKQFLFNGEQFRSDIIEPYLITLRKLLYIMERQSAYRFFNSSLLLMYEGDKLREEPHRTVVGSRNNESNDHVTKDYESFANVSVRMIDFAHVQCNTQNMNSEFPQVVDESYLFGLRSVIKILEDILQELCVST